jgi:hypothetical protein
MDTREKLAKWLYEHYGLVYRDKDFNQISWAEIGFMVKDEYLKEAGELLDTFAFNEIYEAIKEFVETATITDPTQLKTFNRMKKAIAKAEDK